MVKWKYPIVAALILLAGIWLIRVFWPSEEKRIQRAFDSLAEYARKSEGEAPLTAIQKIQRLQSLFGETCELQFPTYGISGSFARQDLSLMAARGRAHFQELELSFHDFSISFPEKEMASVTVTARLRGRMVRGEAVDEPHELRCHLRKIDGQWYFIRLEGVEVLKR
jgi:hypothetical protein